MVDFMNHLVQARRMKSSMGKVMDRILDEEEESELESYLGPGGEGQLVCLKAEEGGEGVEAADKGELNEEMGEEDEFGAVPLRLEGWDLGLDIRWEAVRNKSCYKMEEGVRAYRLKLPAAKVRDGIDDGARGTTTKVDKLQIHGQAQVRIEAYFEELTS